MTEDVTKMLIAGIDALDLKQSTEETCVVRNSANKPLSGSVSQRPIAKFTRRIRIQHVDQSCGSSVDQTQSLGAKDEETTVGDISRLRKDSHFEITNNISTTRPPVVHSAQSKLQLLLLENEKLKKEADDSEAKWNEEISKRLEAESDLKEKEDELLACRKELESLKHQTQQLRSRTTTEQISLSETNFPTLTDISFSKAYRETDYSTRVTLNLTLSKIYTFPAKEWDKTGQPYESPDDGAIAITRLFGNLYASKCGPNPDLCTDFIDKDIWTREAILFSKMLGLPLEHRWAMHAEMQLITFWLTRYLGSAGFEMRDFDNPGAYKACPEVEGGVIRIFISQRVCGSCLGVVERVNWVVGKYGVEFEVVDRRVG
ncbi:hypothetical protein COCSADRAFT_351951 [Bipolaris sorokiniana ND90Pr]|uniref:Uncharacterized protein n=1 Tax=Cochliobolus sativus (strain ND90Pr / ATCC 201652) TaxID=665912 RepID=M2TEK6_COCSN|nr:uncharacterized protein COCSADRAFT_351951 [Bipolaris sorokiniana ND90Pr]EMD67177.1 hypothetical protein COCSADRAFT_351951 [Bipolaris sorokiniana ND90Pr]